MIKYARLGDECLRVYGGGGGEDKSRIRGTDEKGEEEENENVVLGGGVNFILLHVENFWRGED